MTTQPSSTVPSDDATSGSDLRSDGGAGAAYGAAQRRLWQVVAVMSSPLARVAQGLDRSLGDAALERGPWVIVGVIAGIAAWFVLPGPVAWMAAIGVALGVAVAGVLLLRMDRVPDLALALLALGLAVAFGIGLIWARSTSVGEPAIEHPQMLTMHARILEREEQPARDRVRLVLAARDEQGEAMKLRINVPLEQANPAMQRGAVIGLTARLMPPAPPLVPGGYDFARAAWFQGLAATGSVVGPVDVIAPPPPGWGGIASVQRNLSAHVRSQLGGSAGSIAAAFASGDRGAIAEADEVAMRDAGLTHLLSISGLHVSAVVAAAYFLALKLLALWPWLALRVRLPVVAAALGALAGIGYTLLTGAEVPTVRSCAAAVLVLVALALGREPLTFRLLAVAAGFVLLLWPESVVGPSFQMSFAAVLAIVALHNSAPVRAFLAPWEEAWFMRPLRGGAMLLVTGLMIEIALMPIVLFHFHRTGMYGALANMVGIPLVTFVSMPLIALALVADLVGLGAPVWWLAGASLDLLLGIAHLTASQPGAVKLAPHMGGLAFGLFVAGGLWIALWSGRGRFWGFVPVLIATILMLSTSRPDVLVSRDGRDVAIIEGGRLMSLRDSQSSYASDTLAELGALDGPPLPLSQWPGARCSAEFCVATIEREGRRYRLLLARGREYVTERDLAAACARVDIVVADRWLPYSCRPRWLKADRRMLEKTGGLAIRLSSREVETVAQGQGAHGWWHGAGGVPRETERPARRAQ
ncbi:ComEC/Rec2 family competence protein [Citromicrobium sp. WPS32]|uniref:ComEC/Rec2 family competence protein n=1 Tax=Citromicrobium sp. WPS32 TaxID=1634517 RepID=UPI0006C927F2|nr:ComEC/Rec2 family competence protein [Citromicrobium sp. WPS32]MAY77343.1 metal-binding protein [Citromicrobium sp.]